MIIGFDAKRAFHNERGLGNYSRDLIRIMHENFPDNRYLLFNPSPSLKNLMPKELDINQVLPGNIFYKSFPSLWRSFGVCTDLNRMKIDLYHGLSQELPVGINKFKIKKVVTFHDAIFLRYPDLYDKLYREIFIRKNKYTLNVADKIIAISEQSKKDTMDFFNVPEEKIDVVYQGCNQLFRLKYPDEDKNKCRFKFNLPENFILFVGALEERKNLKTLIQAYFRTKKTVPLVIVGKNTTHAPDLKRMVSELGLTSNVIFLHNVENFELPLIYQMSSLFVFPSVFEGFGIPILEALCSGVPVITSSGSCFEETGGEASIYVDPLNTDEMAEAIDNVLCDSDLRSAMINEGYQHAEFFTQDKIATRLMNVYNAVL